MVRNSRHDRRSRARRLVGPLACAMMLASSIGCVTTTTVSSVPGTVSTSVAKRDLGIDYLASRRTAMAIRELTASLDLNPKDPQTHLWLGEAFRRKGKPEEAEKYLLDALRYSDSDQKVTTRHAARLSLSALLSQQGRYEESLEHCESLVDDPTFSTPWRPLTNCGWALFQLGRFDEAGRNFEDALDFFPHFGPALLNLGIVRARQGQTLGAIKTLERALESRRLNASGLAEAHFRLGEIYMGLGRRDMAVTHFRAATDKAPYANWGSQSQDYLDLLL